MYLKKRIVRIKEAIIGKPISYNFQFSFKMWEFKSKNVKIMYCIIVDRF